MRGAVLLTPLLLLASFGCDDDEGTTGGGGTGGGGGETQTSTSTATSTQAGGGCEALGCELGAFCFEGECRACDPTVGSVSDATLEDADSDGQTRAYFLHVPARYTCEAPSAVLVDFHGTATGPRPEEAYQQAALLALAEVENVIVARPRSLSSQEGGFEVFRWDQNQGDLERNTEYARRLVRHLQTRFRIDPARVYASGFSSGANMTAQFFADENRGLFHGLAPIAGGLWGGASTIGPFDDPPRAYFATGYRDYLYPSLRDLRERLEEVAFPAERTFVRELDTGHELYDWQLQELFAWLDRGERPENAPGAPLQPWQTEAEGTLGAVLTLERGTGDVWASTARGEVLTRSAAGAWSIELTDEETAWVGACEAPNGNRYVTAEGKLLRDTGAGFTNMPTLPELGNQAFGFTYGNGLACGPGAEVQIGGYWSALSSANAATTFSDLVADAGGYEAQIAAARTNALGTTVLVGYYDYVGRKAALDQNAQARAHQVVAGWWTDVATAPAGAWFACADSGAIIRSQDDGLSWVSLGTVTSSPLYAIATSPSGNGVVAVGHGGAVTYSRDGGGTWALLPTGLDIMLAAVVFLGEDEVLVGGEGGRVLRAVLP